MRRTRQAIAVLTVLAALGAAPPAGAAPAVGEPFPVLEARDVAGHRRSTGTFRGRRTMVVAITDRHAGEAMRAWWNEADRRLPPDVQRKSIISVDVPFFVSSSYARRRARGEVPRQYWDDTLFDAGHDMADALGLGRGRTPWVFVLDERGRVVAAVHARADAPEAGRIWAALGTRSAVSAPP